MTQGTLPGGLYAITDSHLIPAAELAMQVSAAIRGGAAVIQYRDKTSHHEQRRQQADILASLCRAHGVPLIINDDVGLAAAVGAGVHLGKSDRSIRTARKVLGVNAIIGVSCYNEFERAVEAVNDGADYVAFGRFFPSQSKPHAVTADPALLTQARQALHVPVVAIGGITPENGRPLITAGAHLLAAIHGVFGQPDVQAAARRYAELFTACQDVT